MPEINMRDTSSPKGYWSLICDSESVSPIRSTGINTMLENLNKLQENMPELFPIPPKVMKLATKTKSLENLLVFISDDSEEEIKKSAEAIRRNVYFPFIMYYLKRKVSDSNDKRVLYMHTPDGELYKSSPEENPAGCVWNLISKKTKSTATLQELLPSQVTDRDHLHLPANEEDFQKVIDEKGGKWILHCSDWEELDRLWKNLTRLYVKGFLVGLKSCTPKFSVKEITPNYHTKAIMCYTAAADCKSAVKRAAQNISICTGYDLIMYYKTNAASLVGEYRHEGYPRVTKYMFTSGGEMFERDELQRWEKIIFDQEEHKEIKKDSFKSLTQ